MLSLSHLWQVYSNHTDAYNNASNGQIVKVYQQCKNSSLINETAGSFLNQLLQPEEAFAKVNGSDLWDFTCRGERCRAETAAAAALVQGLAAQEEQLFEVSFKYTTIFSIDYLKLCADFLHIVFADGSDLRAMWKSKYFECPDTLRFEKAEVVV